MRRETHIVVSSVNSIVVMMIGSQNVHNSNSSTGWKGTYRIRVSEFENHQDFFFKLIQNTQVVEDFPIFFFWLTLTPCYKIKGSSHVKSGFQLWIVTVQTKWTRCWYIKANSSYNLKTFARRFSFQLNRFIITQDREEIKTKLFIVEIWPRFS